MWIMWNDNDTTSTSDDLAKLPHGPGAGPGVATPTPARAAPVGSIAQNARPGDDPNADAEFTRFERVAVPTPTGGLRDPGNCSEDLARQIRSGGVSWEAMEGFQNDCGRMGRGSKA